MPGGSGRHLIVAALLVALAGVARGQAPATPPDLPPPADAAGPLSVGVKDLTPPGFADVAHPPPERPEVPGNLLPAVPGDGGFFSTLEFLVLRPRRGGFDYSIPSAAGGLTTSGPVQSLNYELRAGVRAELGYRLGESRWEVLAGYTYLRSSAFDAQYAPPGGVLLPTLTRPGLTDTAAYAGADANLDYNVYDALIARRFAVDDHLALRVLGGVRFAAIHQGFNAFYDGVDARQASVRTRSDFDGFGPVVGGEAVWAGWRGFHLYAKANGGLLTGLSRNPLLEANGNGRAVFVNTAYDVRQVVPFATVGVGGGWQYRTVSVRAGYEITNLIGLVNQPRFTDDVAAGKFVAAPTNLSLEGLFVQVGVQF